MLGDPSLDALFPRTRQAILAVMLMRPEKPWYPSELARHLDVTPSTLQRELQTLVAAGILKMQRRGRMVFFQANTESPIYPELHRLMLKTAGLVHVLRSSLEPLVRKIRAALVYGSMANDTAMNDSDVDLMIIGDVSPSQVSASMEKASEKLGRLVNFTLYSPDEFYQKRSARNHFLTSVLDKPKLFVVGNEGDLDKASGR